MHKFTLPVWIGLRYNLSQQRQRFLSILSWVSLLGTCLGVSALITVLSIMNGFQVELRDRMLDLVSHGSVEAKAMGVIKDWSEVEKTLLKAEGVKAVAPLIGGDAMVSTEVRLKAVEVQGIDMQKELAVGNINQHIIAGNLDDFEQDRYGIVIGSMLSRMLGVYPGDKILLTLPEGQVTPFGFRPRAKRFTVKAVFEVGADIDVSHVYIRIQDARKLYRIPEGVHALRFLSDDAYNIQKTKHRIEQLLSGNPEPLRVTSWIEQKAQLFAAVKMEKIMVTFMLSMVVAVAAFNLLSVLSMMVSEKRSEIAVLRMMGFNRENILLIFLAQGLSLSLIGLLVGSVIGVALSLNLTEMVSWAEKTLGFYIFDPSVYYISGLPSELQAMDVVYVVILSLILSILFSIYPSYRASRIHPVEALQYQ